MAHQWLRAFTALAENTGSIPVTYMVAHSICDSSSRIADASSHFHVLLNAHGTQTYAQAHSHTHGANKQLKIKKEGEAPGDQHLL